MSHIRQQELSCLGPELCGDSTRFRLFSDTAKSAELVVCDADGQPLQTLAMHPRGDGLFSREVKGVLAGAAYLFRLDGRMAVDPYARFLPHGVHGAAEVVDTRFPFRHPRRPLAEGTPIYEVHVGTFTRAGTYAAAARKLPKLVEVGIRAVELMPVAAFAGRHGWGYDSVAPFAPFAPYGRPEQLAAFIDAAHGLGISVLLDVVYNHFGPDGCYLAMFSPSYFSDNTTPWGDAPDFSRAPMRALVLDNVRYWLETYRFDGLRLDAVEAIRDESDEHIVAAICKIAQSIPGQPRIIVEHDQKDCRLVRDFGAFAMWNDDFHHQVHRLLTGEKRGHYSRFGDRIADLARVAEDGWLSASSVPQLPGEQIVVALENHDQVGNRALGERLGQLVPREAYSGASTLLLFLPVTPLLFMGQEWGATSPFLYFTDHQPELGRAVAAGRQRELTRLGQLASAPSPQAKATFDRSRLNWNERQSGQHAQILALYRRLMHLRQSDPVLAHPKEPPRAGSHDGVLWVLRRFGGQKRLLLWCLGEPRALRSLQLPEGPYSPIDLISERPVDCIGRYQAVILA